MQEISRLIKHDDKVTIEAQEGSSRLTFKFNDIEVITRLINGQYPDHRQVIPPAGTTKIIFDRNVLLEAVERASLLTHDSYLKTNVVRLTLEDQNIIINQASEMGKIFEKVPVEVEGDEMKITLSFNIRYIIDVLKNIETEKVSVQTSGSFSACVFRPIESTTESSSDEEYAFEDENYINLVLPLRH
jgi:DNA polymerase-3 subunit beta